MSDKTDLAALFKKWGIDYIETSYNTIKLIQGFNKIGGHYGLFSEFYFSFDGKFIEVAVYDEEQSC